jgi:murein L,D-transpeptidase YafK
MRLISLVLAVAMAFALSGCASKYRTYYGPEVTQILVYKGDRKMYLMHNQKVLESYDIDLGFAPVGHKQFQGDGKTPEGTYRIDRRNPRSEFHLSVGISYPNTRDVAFATSQGKRPGGDIFIHGQPERV